MKRTYLLFGEGRNDKKFLQALSELPKLKNKLTKNDSLYFDNASGQSPRDVLKRCYISSSDRDYNIVICCVDLDKLKQECDECNPKKDWIEEKGNLEEEYENIRIIWHEDNLEDEIVKVLPRLLTVNKWDKSRKAIERIVKFSNSNYLKNLIKLMEL